MAYGLTSKFPSINFPRNWDSSEFQQWVQFITTGRKWILVMQQVNSSRHYCVPDSPQDWGIHFPKKKKKPWTEGNYFPWGYVFVLGDVLIFVWSVQGYEITTIVPDMDTSNSELLQSTATSTWSLSFFLHPIINVDPRALPNKLQERKFPSHSLFPRKHYLRQGLFVFTFKILRIFWTHRHSLAEETLNTKVEIHKSSSVTLSNHI